MRVVVLDKPAIIDGRQRRKGEVVLVNDNTKPAPTKLVDDFNEGCIRKVLVGEPLATKVAEPIKEELDKIK